GGWWVVGKSSEVVSSQPPTPHDLHPTTHSLLALPGSPHELPPAPEWRNGRRSGLKIRRGQPRASATLASGISKHHRDLGEWTRLGSRRQGRLFGHRFGHIHAWRACISQKGIEGSNLSVSVGGAK